LFPHASLDATIRTAFVDAKPTPESCNAQLDVSVHDVACVSGPESWKEPTRKVKLPDAFQQSWNSLLATPAVAVPKSNWLNSAPAAVTAKEIPV
jgi:hypothetical protein